MAQDREFEALVSTIADRVRAELSRQQGGSALSIHAGTQAKPAGGHDHGHGPGHGHGHAHDHPHGDARPGTPCKAGKGECTGCGWSISRRPHDVKTLVELGAHRIGAAPGVPADLMRKDLAQYIDHTLLKANASRDDLKKLCEEARLHRFASVCVNAANVSYCARELRGSGVPVVAVVGFPLGAMTPGAKAYESKEAVRDGAEEIDMVLNIGAMKSKDYALVLDDIRKVVEAAGGRKVKVILEVGELTRDEKVIGCALAKAGGAAFVKTSTGFGPGGATAEDIVLMKALVGPELEVKASGGVRTADDVDAMLKAGATRIGASASVAIVRGATAKGDGKGASVTPIKRATGGY